MQEVVRKSSGLWAHDTNGAWRIKPRATHRQADCLSHSAHTPLRRLLFPTVRTSSHTHTYIHRQSQNTPRAGTPGFRAPEVLLKSPQQTTGEETPAHAPSWEKISKMRTYVHACISMRWAQHELQKTSCFDVYIFFSC